MFWLLVFTLFVKIWKVVRRFPLFSFGQKMEKSDFGLVFGTMCFHWISELSILAGTSDTFWHLPKTIFLTRSKIENLSSKMNVGIVVFDRLSKLALSLQTNDHFWWSVRTLFVKSGKSYVDFMFFHLDKNWKNRTSTLSSWCVEQPSFSFRPPKNILVEPRL